MQVDHVLQLKTLLGDSMELCWVPQALSKRPAGSRASAKDLDLAIRFRIPTVTPPSPTSIPSKTHTPSPVRGRSATRRSIISSASTPPTECDIPIGTQPSENDDSNIAGPLTPTKAQPSTLLPASPSVHRPTSHGRLRLTLLHSFAEHIVADNASLARLGSLQDILQDSSWDATGCPEVPKAVLPTRPSTVAEALTSSTATTPVRSGHSAAMLTPSPSIRSRRDYPSLTLPSPQVTPQSLMPPGDRPRPSLCAASRSPSTSAMGRVPPLQTPPTKMLRRPYAERTSQAAATPFSTPPRHLTEADRASPAPAGAPANWQHSVPAAQHTGHTTPLKSFPAELVHDTDEPTTPRKAAVGEAPGLLASGSAFGLPLPFATPSQTPKRKRGVDGSPAQTLPCTPASSRPPVRVLRTPGSKRGDRCAIGTPGRTPRKELVVRGSTASPHVRKAILAHSRSPKFEGALPIVQMRAPGRSPRPTPTKAALRDVYGKSAHCASVPATPASAKSAQSQLQPLVSPMSSKRVVNFASPVADATAFYSAAAPGSRSRGKACIGEVGKGSSRGKPSGAGHPAAQLSTKPVCDAAALAASIMDSDMAALLHRNARSAAAKQVAEDPKNIRQSIEKVCAAHCQPAFCLWSCCMAGVGSSLNYCRRHSRIFRPCMTSFVLSLRGSTA